ncbi:MAG: bifunctional proline dehydrogenase/L-glutamate gamma-semialdehyde dehydrogenase PutA [Pseudomonadota bacterium]
MNAPILPPSTPAYDVVRELKHMAEDKVVEKLLAAYPPDRAGRDAIAADAARLIEACRARKGSQKTVDAFLHEFGLSNREGVALMCLAEALLRIPDDDTQDALIAEKIKSGDWTSHLGETEGGFVNAGVWALVLTGKVVELDDEQIENPISWVKRLIGRVGEPVIRTAVNQAMRIMGKRFVFGRTIEEALERRRSQALHDRLFSFDMLGEGARTLAAAERFFDHYGNAIEAVGKATSEGEDILTGRSSVSIKLSALDPRYEQSHHAQVMARMVPPLVELAARAKHHDIQFTIDAEEADRLDLSLDIFDHLAKHPSLKGWDGLGLAVQAYQKRALPLVDWIDDLARATARRFPVRLVKGAYWDTEIKHAQVEGYADYPVFTRKATTDLSYLATASRMLSHGKRLYPMFATHNAHSMAAIVHLADSAPYEFQRLHGMGDVLYVAAREMLLDKGVPVRVYAPVGQHQELLPYLVRRLLENGANSSFVNQFLDDDVPVEDLVEDPVDFGRRVTPVHNPQIPKPIAIYGDERPNTLGFDLTDRVAVSGLVRIFDQKRHLDISAASLISGSEVGGEPLAVTSPADRSVKVGTERHARAQDREAALSAAEAAQPGWDLRGGAARGAILRAVGDAIEAHRDHFLYILAHEAGRTLADGIAEVREAADFCRYYAAQAEREFETPHPLPGPTGESNVLSLHGRGTFLCISPWNFPLAIFAGQIAAALAAGNVVIAKPADQTPIVAFEAVKLFHKAGVPGDVLHLLLGSGPDVAAPLVDDERISGVAFTGSTATAKTIQRALAARDGAIVPLIAETGGQNAMVVDSTALMEQVADDVMSSGFSSAGQRCSALRVLMVQDAVADECIAMLKGALAEQHVGLPWEWSTDVGPIIDERARAGLEAHVDRIRDKTQLIAEANLSDETSKGVFFAPRLIEISSLDALEGEVFGPIVHILRFQNKDLDTHLGALAKTGYGLTFGLHSRLEGRYRELFSKTRAGNVYVNRNIIGAVVGSQPFGGQGISGTGPKAGGPHYLQRFAVERVMTINTAAIGGNTELFSLPDTPD